MDNEKIDKILNSKIFLTLTYCIFYSIVNKMIGFESTMIVIGSTILGILNCKK